MIEIRLEQEKLIISSVDTDLSQWNFKSLFETILGMEWKPIEKTYHSKKGEDLNRITREIIDSLEADNLEFNLNPALHDLLSIIKIEEKQIESILTNSTTSMDNEYKSSREFTRKLIDNQIDAVNHLILIGNGANFSVPGSGKTTIILAYFDYLKSRNLVDGILVIGPYSCFTPWETEFEGCFDRSPKTLRLNSPKNKSIMLLESKFELYLVHYQTMSNDINSIKKLLQKRKFLMVVDESHYVKRFSGGKWSEALSKLSQYPKFRVILTGTPMPNGYLDLYSQFNFLWPNGRLLGSSNEFKNLTDSPDGRATIKERIRPFFFRITKKQLNLPEPKTVIIRCPLSPIQAKIYEVLAVKFLADLNLVNSDVINLRKWRRAKMVRLIQAASNPTLLNYYSDEFDLPPISSVGSSIVQLIEEYPKYEVPAKFLKIRELVQNLLLKGKKILIWTTFTHNIEMLKLLLNDFEYYCVYGEIPKDESEDKFQNRDNEIHKFKTSPNPCLLIANPAACAESISLHFWCHDAIYLDRNFNCGQFIQSMDRIHRVGLDKDIETTYYILEATNTIDEVIHTRINQKMINMISLLEDELPEGDADFISSIETVEKEETEDFIATVNSINNSN